ncbi:tetratricopeptide repeat protein [Flavobacterium rhizosphaerae]|uniref:Tetratricopeptide repeat protein n=1 Tax=Flavobacterium rhizosphaerae TaxID=3163298 RepID=A0ABW8Z0J5_9FLAO
MKQIKFLGLSLLLFGMANAQDANDAIKAIDAEQYQKAKNTLKSLIASNPDEGKNYFLLGDIYLTQAKQDSAAIFFNQGKSVKKDAEYNLIGLGNIDLNNGDAAAAKVKFDKVQDEMRRRDVDQLVYIGRAYIYADNPDYKKAIEILKKAVEKDDKSAKAYLNLGEAYYRDKQQNEAYRAFRTASQLDNGLLRAKLQLGVLTKNTRAAFPEAVKAFNDIIAQDANYGPAYRELAETYYLWANTDTAKYNQYIKQALDYYEKYMKLTDYSLDSRMRHADFLVLTRDYKALEQEAKKMQQIDQVNPRILRYLSYSAYENGNFEESLTAMKDFMSKVDPKRLIARDYLYLGLAKLATSVGEDEQGNATITDQVVFDEAIENIKKAAEMDIEITNEFNAIGKKLFGQKLYGPAAVVFDIATTNPDNRNLFYDNFYLAYSVYYNHVNMSEEDKKQDTLQLQRADSALAVVVEMSPDAQDAYLYKARVNQNLQSEEAYRKMAEAYDNYIRIVTEKGPEEVQKQKANLIEAYSNAGAYYVVTNKQKATEYFNKVLELDPEDAYAKQQLEQLNK